LFSCGLLLLHVEFFYFLLTLILRKGFAKITDPAAQFCPHAANAAYFKKEQDGFYARDESEVRA
jgi:hypothetical protein